MSKEKIDTIIEGIVLIVALIGAMVLYYEYQNIPDWLIAVLGMLVGLPVQRSTKQSAQ